MAFGKSVLHPLPTLGPQLRAPATQTRRLLTIFHVSGQAYALPAEAIQEILPVALLSRPPGLPAMLAGFLDLGRKAVPVVRLDHLFSLPTHPLGLYTPLLILKSGSSWIALLAEDVIDVVSVAAEDVTGIRENSTVNDCADGLVMLETGHAILLSPERILVEQERRRIAELAAGEQARIDALEVHDSCPPR